MTRVCVGQPITSLPVTSLSDTRTPEDFLNPRADVIHETQSWQPAAKISKVTSFSLKLQEALLYLVLEVHLDPTECKGRFC